MKWKKSLLLVLSIFVLVLTSVNGQLAELAEASYDMEMPDGKTVVYTSKEDASKELRIWTEQEEYRCLQKCKIPVCIENTKLLSKADSIIPDSQESKELKEIIKESEITKDIDKKKDEFVSCYEFEYEVSPNTPSTKVDFKFDIDGETFILDPTILSGCTESASLIECTGSLTGQWVNNSNPNRIIWIHDATISASGFFNVTSEGSINITDTTINAQGSAGSAGSDSGVWNCGTIGSRSAGNGNAGSSGKIIIESKKSLLIQGSILNGYGGAGGRGGDISCTLGSGDHDLDMNAGTSGAGGNGFINVTSKLNMNISNTVTFNAYGGAGGRGGHASGSAPTSGCGGGSSIATDGANGGTGYFEINSVSSIISGTVNVNSYGGAAGVGGDGSSSDAGTVSSGNGGNGGSAILNINVSNINMTSVTSSHSAASGGTKGSRSVKASCGNNGQVGVNGVAGTSSATYTFSTYAFLDTFTDTATNAASTFHKIIGTEALTKFILQASSIPQTHYFTCTKMIYFLSGNSNENLDFTSCPSYLASTLSELYYPFPTFANNVSNATAHAPYINDTTQIRIDLNDNQDLSNLKIANNLTGTFQNVSEINFTGTETNYTLLYNLTTNLSRFNRVAVQFWVNDSGAFTNQTDIYLIDVRNALPVISVSLDPSPIQAGQDAICNPSITDKDGDSNWQDNITIWIKNGVQNLSSQAYNKSVFKAGNFTTNDKIQCMVSAFDGFEWSSNYSSLNVTVGDTTAPTISNIEVSGVSFDVTQNVKINATVIDASSSFDFVRVTVNRTNYTMTATGGNTFAYTNLFAIGNYNVTEMHAKDSSGNSFSNTSVNIQFVVTATSTTVIVNAGGGGGGESAISKNATFNLMTENFGEEYFSISAKAKALNEVTILIENRGEETSIVKLSCKESSKIGGAKLCDFVSFDKDSYEVPPSNFPVEAKMGVRFGDAKLLDTFSLVVEGNSEGAVDDLRVSFIIFPTFKDALFIVKQTLIGTLGVGDPEDPIPFPQIILLILFEGIMVLAVVKSGGSTRTVVILGVIIYLVVATMDLQLCKLATCSTIGGI